MIISWELTCLTNDYLLALLAWHSLKDTKLEEQYWHNCHNREYSMFLGRAGISSVMLWEQKFPLLFTNHKYVPVLLPRRKLLLVKLNYGVCFRMVGPTTVYSLLQAVGVVNDHMVACHRYKACVRKMQDCKITTSVVGAHRKVTLRRKRKRSVWLFEWFELGRVLRLGPSFVVLHSARGTRGLLGGFVAVVCAP